MVEMEVTAWKAAVEWSMGRPSRKAKMTMAQTARIGVPDVLLMADHRRWKGTPPSRLKDQSILNRLRLSSSATLVRRYDTSQGMCWESVLCADMVMPIQTRLMSLF